MQILPIVGLCATGKSEVVSYLGSEYNMPRVYFGGYVLEELNRSRLPVTPDNEKQVREKLRETHGMDAMAKLAIPEIRNKIQKSEKIVIDGLYSLAEYQLLYREFGRAVLLIAIHAQRDFRYKRSAPIRRTKA